MKGVASTIILLIIAAIIVVAVLYNYKPSENLTKPTGRAVSGSTDVGRLGFLESCNPNRDRCDVGLICALGRDNIYYRCLRTG